MDDNRTAESGVLHAVGATGSAQRKTEAVADHTIEWSRNRVTP